MYLAIVICNVFNWAKMNSTAAISGKKQTKKEKQKTIGSTGMLKILI